MAIFIELKKNFAFLGIKADGQSSFSVKQSIIAFLLACCSFGMGAFMLFEPKSLMEFVNSFYGTACSVLNFSTYSSNVLKRTKIFGFLARIEDIIKKRKFCSDFILVSPVLFTVEQKKIIICTEPIFG